MTRFMNEKHRYILPKVFVFGIFIGVFSAAIYYLTK